MRGAPEMPESWSLLQLEQSLTRQLASRSLRNRNVLGKILLLMHQHSLSRGWDASLRNFLSFDQIVERLRKLAAEIATAFSTGPQMQGGVIDVSLVEEERRAGKGRRKPKAQHHTA